MNINSYVQALHEKQKELMEGMINAPSDSLEKYHCVVGKVLGLRYALDALAQQLADD